MSPLKKVVLLAVPVAERSAVITTAPLVAAVGVRSINEPSVVSTVSTIFAGTLGIEGKACKAPVPSM